MTPEVQFSTADRDALHDALGRGDADAAFLYLAEYLRRNQLQLSDETMRRYAAEELFACFAGRGETFEAMFRSPSG